MIVQSKAIVLRVTDFQESSRIALLFTRDQGKLSVIAKGARSPKSKFISKLEPGNLLDVIYYHKQGRSIQTLSEATLLETYAFTSYKPDLFTCKLAFTDLLGRLLHDDEINIPLFDNSLLVLSWMNTTDVNLIAMFPYIMIKMSEWMGIAIHMELSDTDSGVYRLEPGSGCVRCSSTFSDGLQLSEQMVRYMKYVFSGDKKQLIEMSMNESDCRQLIFILDRYLSYHFEGLKPRTTEILFDSYLEISS